MDDPTSKAIDPLEIYKLQSTRFTNLNDTLYRIPPMFATVIGALWYFAVVGAAGNRLIGVLVFALAALVGFSGAVAVRRLSGYMTAYLNNLEDFERPYNIRRVPGTSTAKAILGLMYGSIIMSYLGVCWTALTRS